MNQGQTQQAQAQGQSQSQPGPAGGQQSRQPMYQPGQIRSLPLLSDDEKSKYEQGLRGLWTKANTSPANSPDQIAARQKIIDFSRMLITKIQQRRQQAQQQAQQAQQAGQAGQAPSRPPSAQQSTPAQPAATPAAKAQQKVQPSSAPGTVAHATATQSGPDSLAQNQKPPVATVTTAPAPAPAPSAQRPKIPDNIMQHVNKMVFRAPAHIANKSAADINRWVEEMKDKYARALFTMESSKGKVANMEKVMKDRINQGKPLQDEENRQYTIRKEQQLKLYSDAHKWVDSLLKQQESIQATQQHSGSTASGQSSAAATSASSRQAGNTSATAQSAVQSAATSVSAAVDAARNEQQLAAAANRPSLANGTSTPTPTQAQARPVPQPPHQPQGSAQVKAEQPHPPPVNTAQAQGPAARHQNVQSGAPVTAGGPTRALSHSAAMTLANQRAANTPGGAATQVQLPASSSTAAGGPVNQAMVPGAVQPPQQQQQQQQQQPQPHQQLHHQPQHQPPPSQQQQQQGHSHAHPTQSPTTQSPTPTHKMPMPIPRQLPDKVTAIPQGVSLGGGVSAGRPTMPQGSGTLGGVMNQPPVAKIPAYSHDAEGDRVLSKKKLDELVRQVCGGSGDSQDGNLLSPDVEESVLNMADSFVDNVLQASCRNAKERGSKVLEIRDIQLVLERTYNIRVPGYSSDELRTVRKVLPSAGWIAKMSAVQAAKVMPGKGDP
ncbi:hypothetical protein E4U42_002518 [Claviceps africana]|uniref:Transcription initiation factor TFIID subunit 12 domain-containing protein n=1 Tax=Claviceps africana TaxID=83212 RepID=A0A8K0J8M6_9HYPO|nr:hypothetical protein E4U42_002518 [Claviceps africana]